MLYLLSFPLCPIPHIFLHSSSLLPLKGGCAAPGRELAIDVVFQRRRRSDELTALEAHFSSGCYRERAFYHWWLLVNKVRHFSTAIIWEE